ncbi:GntR family transcriptional regulator [Streptomyces sp. NPDC003327]
MSSKGCPGQRIQPEARPYRDLATEYGVAHLTVRRAAQVLRERSPVLTVHGKGTFVAGPLPGDEGPHEG